MRTNKKIIRGRINTTHIDKHGDQMTPDGLTKAVEYINNPNIKLRYGIDHRQDFPPKGFMSNAELIHGDGFYAVDADFCEFEKREEAEWDRRLIIESSPTPFTFIEVKSQPVDGICISTDPHNFNTQEEYQKYIDNIRKASDTNIEINESLRKAELPIPEITITLTGSVLAYQLLKPTLKSLGEKVADKSSDIAIESSKKIFEVISTALSEAFYRLIPKTRPVTTIFSYPGEPHIQLIAKTRDSNLILKALIGNRISKIFEQIEDLKKHVDIAKVQFILNSKGKWTFNYLLTTDGKSIGTKKVISERERKHEMMLNDANKAGRPLGVSTGMVVKGAGLSEKVFE